MAATVKTAFAHSEGVGRQTRHDYNFVDASMGCLFSPVETGYRRLLWYECLFACLFAHSSCELKICMHRSVSGNKYHLSNQNVTIYQQENKSLVLSTNSTSSNNITWILDPKSRSRAQSIRQYLRIDNLSNLIIDFNARLNDVVVLYSINQSYSSATARLLVGGKNKINWFAWTF